MEFSRQEYWSGLPFPSPGEEIWTTLKYLKDLKDVSFGLPRQGGTPGFHPWIRKIPWRREWLPTPVFFPGEFHRQRSLAGYSMGSPRVGHNWTTNTFTFTLWIHHGLFWGAGLPWPDWIHPAGLRWVRLASTAAHCCVFGFLLSIPYFPFLYHLGGKIVPLSLLRVFGWDSELNWHRQINGEMYKNEFNMYFTG